MTACRAATLCREYVRLESMNGYGSKDQNFSLQSVDGMFRIKALETSKIQMDMKAEICPSPPLFDKWRHHLIVAFLGQFIESSHVAEQSTKSWA